MFDIKIFSERLKTIRTKKGLSQADLAKAVGVSAATISSYETPNGTKIPALDKAAAIAKALEVSLDWLCGADETKNEKLDGLELLNILSEIIDMLDMTTYVSSENEFGYNERLNLICDNKDVIAFFREREKILPLLQDDTLADYLKEGLKKALFEKFKNFALHDDYPF